MKLGTKSLLFGVHQFLWHPLTVLLAWRRLYGSWPNWWQCIAIALHDVGYWGCENMDGPEGRQHPFEGARLAAEIAGWFYRGSDKGEFRTKVFFFTFRHSRELSKRQGAEPSELCWADKYCVVCEPRWFYLFRARLSGELAEYTDNAFDIRNRMFLLRIGSVDFNGLKGPKAAEKFWFEWYRAKVKQLCKPHQKGTT